MLMVKTPKQELDERTCGWIYNRLKAPLECFINKWVEDCWIKPILKVINGRFHGVGGKLGAVCSLMFIDISLGQILCWCYYSQKMALTQPYFKGTVDEGQSEDEIICDERAHRRGGSQCCLGYKG